mmetsp:Transcript_86927/g.278910  ORF Transcript_86927/g.278910 Transcript_86927/m.278910 type:complete len:256 (+) Transcript_86927:185-952(+)
MGGRPMASLSSSCNFKISKCCLPNCAAARLKLSNPQTSAVKPCLSMMGKIRCSIILVTQLRASCVFVSRACISAIWISGIRMLMDMSRNTDCIKRKVNLGAAESPSKDRLPTGPTKSTCEARVASASSSNISKSKGLPITALKSSIWAARLLDSLAMWRLRPRTLPRGSPVTSKVHGSAATAVLKIGTKVALNKPSEAAQCRLPWSCGANFSATMRPAVGKGASRKLLISGFVSATVAGSERPVIRSELAGGLRS